MSGKTGKTLVAGIAASWLLAVGFTASAADSKPGNSAGPQIRSAAALIVDANNGEVIYQRKPGLVAPIASITKLMTALVVMDALQPLDEVITISNDDKWKGKGAFSRLPVGAKLTRGDLLRLALMASENRAAHTLARNYPGGVKAFVRTMNLKAKALGMTQTRFDDASGLSSNNVSSARDLVKLVNAASRNSVIREYSTLPRHDFRVGRSMLTYGNTNLLIGRPDWNILVQKTGYTSAAGQCLVMETMIEERPVVMVLMNSFGTLTRTADARRIRKWIEAQSAPKVANASTGNSAGELAK